LDFPKNRITNQTLCLLLPLARESGLHDKTDAMFSGATVNVTENSAVLQVALRAPKGATVIQWFWKKAGGLGFTLLLLLSVSVVRAQDAASQARPPALQRTHLLARRAGNAKIQTLRPASLKTQPVTTHRFRLTSVLSC